MKDHLRFATCYWHTFTWPGLDPFGGPTFERPWMQQGDPIEKAEEKLDEAFDFLNKTSIQIDRPGGFSELFAVSLSNVPTNLVVANDNKYPVVGFFCVSAVNGLGNTLDDEEIEKIELYNREW